MKTKYIILLIILYILGIFGTYGYAYKEEVKWNKKNYPTLSPAFCADSMAGLESILWPVYIAGHFSYKVWNNE